MVKKIVVIFLYSLFFVVTSNFTYASSVSSPGFGEVNNFGQTTTIKSDYLPTVDGNKGNIQTVDQITNEAINKNTQETMAADKAAADKVAADKAAEAERDAACAGSETCIDKTSFTVDTSLFSVGGTGLKGYNSKATLNTTLETIIQKLMIALGVVSLFVMTIGAGYMIMYQGRDEYLSKGKNIFMGGITALIVALCSYYLVNLVGYILYK